MGLLSDEKLSIFKENQTMVGVFNPYKNKDKIQNLSKKKINVFSLELLPRITRAQSMDILSSQANLAGYKAVIDSFSIFEKAIPMMMTAAGTVPAAKVLVVEGTDDLETKEGYAKEASEDFKKKQEELIFETLKKIDIVICTALIPGKKAPIIITEKMIENMKAGSVIYDLAAVQGGNSAYTRLDEIVEKNGVKILGEKNILNKLAISASSLYAKNLFNFVLNLYDKKNNKVNINLEDEIIEKTIVK